MRGPGASPSSRHARQPDQGRRLRRRRRRPRGIAGGIDRGRLRRGRRRRSPRPSCASTRPPSATGSRLLKPGAPALLWRRAPPPRRPAREDFEDGLTGWTQDQEVGLRRRRRASRGRPRPTAPGDHTGGVAYGPDPDGRRLLRRGADDISSRDSIISPAITVPGRAPAPRMSFDHYVATEADVRRRQRQGQRQRRCLHASSRPSAYLFNGRRRASTDAWQHQPDGAARPPSPAPTAARSTARGAPRIVDLAKAGARPATR